MKSLLCVLFIFLTTVPVFAADADRELDRELDDLGSILVSDPERARALIEELASSGKKFTPEQNASFLVHRSVLKLLASQFSEALVLLNQAEVLSTSATLLNTIRAYQATAYIPLKEYPKALEVMTKNLAQIERIDDVSIKASSYIRLSALYLEMDAWQEMAHYSQQALALGSELDSKNHCYALLYLAVSDLKLERLNESFERFSASRAYCQANKFPLIVAMSTKGLGIVELKRSNFVQAERLLLQSLEAYLPFQFQLEINHIHALLSETYLGLDEPVKALANAESVMALPDESSNLKFKKITTKVLAELASMRGEHRQAYQYLSRHQAISNTLLDETKAKAHAYQVAKFENSEKTREINLLTRERELYLAQQRLTERQNTNMVMFVTLLVGGVLFLTVMIFASVRQKRRFQKLAYTDRLTGIYNRGAGQDFAENEFVQICMRNADFSVIVFDLDFFKKINDNFGHGTGDWALKKVVAEVKPLIRESDIFTRMGGEEFAIFLPYSDQGTAMEIAERCRKKIAKIDTQYSGHSFSMTASFGVAHNSEDDLSLDPLLKRADLAMYASKESGRNRITAFTREMVEQSSPETRQDKLVFN